MDRHIPFFDGYWYCYANATAMLLGASGVSIRPAELEVLSGVGLGAVMLTDGLPFFSGAAGLPDRGITRALEILGFAFEERAQEDGSAPPFDWLASRLASGPVVVGPLDMSLLRYNPGRPSGGGVDHYILVSELDTTNVGIYDPAGYAGVSLSRELFAESWRASTIAYRRGRFAHGARRDACERLPPPPCAGMLSLGSRISIGKAWRSPPSAAGPKGSRRFAVLRGLPGIAR